MLILKMLESGTLQNSVPEQADKVFQTLAEDYEVLDLQDSLEPGELLDAVHANRRGRLRLSLQDWLSR